VKLNLGRAKAKNKNQKEAAREAKNNLASEESRPIVVLL
jgi:hypothetical protein